MLKAMVKRVTGQTAHFAAQVENGAVVACHPLSTPAWVKIDVTEEGCFLLYFDSAGAGITDTWHQTLELAKAQARFEFEIEGADWFDEAD